MMVKRALLALLAVAMWAPALAGERTVEATVMRVIDGDTIRVSARIGLAANVMETVSVRLRGIDTPELRSRCDAELAAARAAKRFVERVVTPTVTLSEIAPDKYAGRIDAWVRLATGEDLSALILAAGFGRPYDGGRRAGWCGDDDAAVGR